MAWGIMFSTEKWEGEKGGRREGEKGGREGEEGGRREGGREGEKGQRGGKREGRCNVSEFPRLLTQKIKFNCMAANVSIAITYHIRSMFERPHFQFRNKPVSTSLKPYSQS